MSTAGLPGTVRDRPIHCGHSAGRYEQEARTRRAACLRSQHSQHQPLPNSAAGLNGPLTAQSAPPATGTPRVPGLAWTPKWGIWVPLSRNPANPQSSRSTSTVPDTGPARYIVFLSELPRAVLVWCLGPQVLVLPQVNEMTKSKTHSGNNPARCIP